MKPWMKDIQRGDVLESGSGTVRIVRDVKRWTKPGYDENLCVVFLIRRCSWTHRCYTILWANDLHQQGYRPTGRKVKLESQFDKIVEEEFDLARKSNPPTLTCCDVIGIP